MNPTAKKLLTMSPSPKSTNVSTWLTIAVGDMSDLLNAKRLEFDNTDFSDEMLKHQMAADIAAMERINDKVKEAINLYHETFKY